MFLLPLLTYQKLVREWAYQCILFLKFVWHPKRNEILHVLIHYSVSFEWQHTHRKKGIINESVGRSAIHRRSYALLFWRHVKDCKKREKLRQHKRYKICFIKIWHAKMMIKHTKKLSWFHKPSIQSNNKHNKHKICVEFHFWFVCLCVCKAQANWWYIHEKLAFVEPIECWLGDADISRRNIQTVQTRMAVLFAVCLMNLGHCCSLILIIALIALIEVYLLKLHPHTIAHPFY